MQQDKKPVIYWILQDNQVTPYIVDFLELIKLRLQGMITIEFLIPSFCSDALKISKKLNPRPFKISSGSLENSFEGYQRKKELLGEGKFAEGLLFYRTLLLDDLGGGNLFQIKLHLSVPENIQAFVLQIPTPLGSSEKEERLFYACVHFAKKNSIPVFGYELLPLNTRWTLAPSLLDGIICTSEESFDLFNTENTDLGGKTWLVPRYESRFFSPATTPLWKNGLGTAYKYQKELNINPDKTLLYLPHNVAMIYEYKILMKMLQPLGEKLHLMLSVGRDQIRGTYTHDEIIKLVCSSELKHFSYSFHDLNKSWEMTMADGVIACAECYGTCISSFNNIPTIIYDPAVPTYEKGEKRITNSQSALIKNVKKIIESHEKRTEISKILAIDTKNSLNKLRTNSNG